MEECLAERREGEDDGNGPANRGAFGSWRQEVGDGVVDLSAMHAFFDRAIVRPLEVGPDCVDGMGILRPIS